MEKVAKLNKILKKEKNVNNNEKNKKSTRIYYLDILRIIAIFAVIMIHVSGCDEFYKINVNSYEWNVFNIYNCIARFAVPVFFMISGILFLNPKKELSMKKLYGKNILRLVTAFTFWSLIYTILKVNRMFPEFTHEKFVYSIKQFAAGEYHMWFLRIIIGLYIITPILRKIVKDKKITEYFLALSFIFSIVIPTIKICLPDSKIIFTDLGINFVCGYTFYYILGYYMNNIKFTQKQRYIIYALGIVGTICTIFGSKIISLRIEKLDTALVQPLTLNVCMQGVTMFVFIKTIFENKKISDRLGKIITTFSELSFGVYLIHVAFLNWLKEYNITAYCGNPLFSVMALTIDILIVCNIIVFILKHIPIVKKYIV